MIFNNNYNKIILGGGIVIRNISRLLEGFIYILLGVVVSVIVIMLFISSPSEDLTEVVGEITGILLVIISVIQLLPTILNRYVNSPIDNASKQFLYNTVCVLRNIHIALGILFIGLGILHAETNLLFESTEWDMETMTGIVLGLILIPTIIYAILRINNSEKYRKPHRFFLLLTYIMIIIHLLD